MNKRILALLSALLLTALLTACGGGGTPAPAPTPTAAPQVPVVGTWTHTDQAGAVASYTFEADNRMEYTAQGQTLSGSYAQNGDQLTLLFSGGMQYDLMVRVEGDTLTTTQAGVAVEWQRTAGA